MLQLNIQIEKMLDKQNLDKFRLELMVNRTSTPLMQMHIVIFIVLDYSILIHVKSQVISLGCGRHIQTKLVCTLVPLLLSHITYKSNNHHKKLTINPNQFTNINQEKQCALLYKFQIYKFSHVHQKLTSIRLIYHVHQKLYCQKY